VRGREQLRRHTPVELGNEPPLAVGDGDPSRYTRRGVSLRWLFGAVVTGLTSVALMGGALVAALDGRYVVEAQAALSEATATVPLSRRAAKGDLVQEPEEEETTRRVIEVTTVVRQGDEDHIAKRPYALVTAGLVLDNDAIGDVPALNARELQNREVETPAAATDAIYEKSVDGEITVSVEAFPLDGGPVAFASDIALDETEIERQLIQETAPGAPAAVQVEIEAYLEPASRVPENVTIVPQNVSQIVKTADTTARQDTDTDLVELVQRGDTLDKVLRGNGISEEDAAAIAAVLGERGAETLRPGQILRITFQVEEIEESARRRLGRFTIYEDGEHLATVAMTDGGSFVPGESPGPAPVVDDVVAPATNDRLPTIYRSLYQTLVDNALPQRVRDVVLGTFSLDVDFNARVRPGDRLTVLYSAEADANPEAAAEILYLALTAAGVERRFYRFKTKDGGVDYYDGDGRTGDKFLLRKPMARGVFRSGFGMRRHPILRRQRMHNGVDYAAPRGTPIYAAGDGVVRQAGWKAGYGRWVKLAHKNGYETGYAHQSRIADGIKPGVPVKQGQVIGYVGSTGFSTGPHLHYEVHVNGRPVNPLTIRLRRGRELTGAELATFRSERDRIDALIDERATRLARR